MIMILFQTLILDVLSTSTSLQECFNFPLISLNSWRCTRCAFREPGHRCMYFVCWISSSPAEENEHYKWCRAHTHLIFTASLSLPHTFWTLYNLSKYSFFTYTLLLIDYLPVQRPESDQEPGYSLRSLLWCFLPVYFSKQAFIKNTGYINNI